MIFNEKICNTKFILLQLVLFLLVFVSNCTRAASTEEEWNIAGQPNYITNVDLKCPFSNKTFQHKRPDCSGDHGDDEPPCISTTSSVSCVILDFWGEGRLDYIVGGKKIVSGFQDAYNVNHQYQLVSNSPIDEGRRIPNRIPTIGYDPDISLSKYITDKACVIITMMSAPPIWENLQTLEEMIRILDGRDSRSAIIVYVYSITNKERKMLTEKFAEKGLIENPKYIRDIKPDYLSKKLLEPSTGEPIAFTYHSKDETYDL